MKKRYTNSILSKIYDYAVANYRKMDGDNFVLGELPYNYKCHLNAVQKVKEGKATKVILCVAIDKNDYKRIVVHFINQLKNGKYQDNTWGWVYEDYNYYMVKEVDSTEFNRIGDLLNGLRDTLINHNSNRILRKLFGVKNDETI